jgi:hypothetical protein
MLALGLALGSLSTNVQAAPLDDADSADACVGFENEVGDKLLTIHARNSCERRLSCTLDYTVLCEDSEGKQTSKAAKHMAFQLGKQGSQDLALSATSCKQGWRIDALEWTCS